MTNNYVHSIELEGQTFTRTSHRKYTHVVVGRADIKRLRNNAAGTNSTIESNARYYAQLVAGTHPHALSKIGDTKTGQERAIANGFTTDIAANVRKQIELNVARTEKQIAEGAGQMTVLQWSMNQLNAAKGARKSYGYWIDVTVLPVTSRVPATKIF